MKPFHQELWQWNFKVMDLMHGGYHVSFTLITYYKLNALKCAMVKLGIVKQADGMHNSLDNITHLVQDYLSCCRSFLMLSSQSHILC